jgi:bifunctional non-homologous end joining protein LigD
LKGEKLKGGWTLVRMPPRPKDRNLNWLLIKEKDKYAKPEGPSLPKNDDESVLSRRSMTEIEKASDRVWQSGRGEIKNQGSKKKTVKAAKLSASSRRSSRL